ncbi:MAG: HEAT repeat domain-containing protein [Myxococcota bacterium]
MGGVLRCAAGLLLVAALGCEGESEVGESRAERPPAPAAAPPGPVAESPRPKLQPGKPVLRDGRVWLQARNEARDRLLFRLSETAGFAVEVAGLDPAPVSAEFEDAELAQVLSVLAGDLPFALDYELDARSGRHELVSVRVGVASEASPASASVAVAPAPVARASPRALEPSRTPEHERLLRSLEIANLEARRELVGDLEPVGIQLDALAHVLHNDPDPEIRSLAAETLATADSYGAVRTLVAALEEEDPDVLLEVIEALEFAGDETITGELEPLLEHRDRRVRTAAQEAIEFLE